LLAASLVVRAERNGRVIEESGDDRGDGCVMEECDNGRGVITFEQAPPMIPELTPGSAPENDARPRRVVPPIVRNAFFVLLLPLLSVADLEGDSTHSATCAARPSIVGQTVQPFSALSQDS
jgi:hypothetical protein